MGQAVGMEDLPTPMYDFFALTEDDPYVSIAYAASVHDFMIPPIPPLCYPYAPIPYEGYGLIRANLLDDLPRLKLLMASFCDQDRWEVLGV
ncbi:hypothetical protein GYH30_001097 [Glycine max]|nr:hypothetical protein GYH30_001097 [Glycine max]